MAGLDLTHMAPSDAEAAMRSYPRRYAAVFRRRDDEDLDEIANRVGADGASAAAIVFDVVRTWALLREGLRQTLTVDDPVLHAAVIDPAERVWAVPSGESVDTLLGLLTDEATAFADDLEHVALESWNRKAAVADNTGVTTVHALDLAKEAVRVGHDGLPQAEAALIAARR